MVLIKDPYEELRKWRKRYHGLFPDVFEREFGPVVMEDLPLTDVKKSKGRLIIKVGMPGLRKKDIDVDITEGTVSVKGAKEEEREKKGKRSYKKEMRAAAYKRVFALPEPVNPKTAKAKYEDGVLEISVKTKERKKREKLEIK